ncbi:integrase, catalytic region, zinc finger, CCHC-type containing protein [Tanacetum coccineum]
MYRIIKSKTQTPDSKTNIHVSNYTSVESSNSVRRPKSKGTKSKNRVLKNTKSSSAYVQKISRSVSIDSNKCETKDLNVCQTNASVSNSKTVNAVNDCSNIVCVSCGKDVFLLSNEKCVARYALSRNSNVKRALFTTLVAAKSKNLGATSVVAKSRLSVANTPKATNKVIQLILWIVNSGCSKHMTGNIQLLRNFVEKFMGTVHFGNDHFTAITRYGDYVQGNLTICHIYYVEGLIHNLFSVRQFCDGDLEVAFCSNTCYVRNLEGDDLLTGSCDLNLYNIFISEMATSFPVCLMSRATSTKSGLWHCRLSHLNFEAARTMIIFSKPPEFLLAKAISTACFTQNHSNVHIRYNKTPYELVRGRKPNIQYFYVFGYLCYPTNDHDDLGKMKPKADIGNFIGYSESSSGFRIYNRRIKKIMETIHVKFDELINMASECHSLEPRMNCMNFQDSSEDSQSIPSKSDLDNLFGPLYEEYYATSSQEVSDNSAANTLDNEHTSSSSLIVVEEDEAPQIVSSSAEQVSTEPNSLVLNENADEFIQEDVADFNGNVFYNAPLATVFEEAESSSTYQDPSNMHEFYQKTSLK